MNVLFIDSLNRTVSEVEIEKGYPDGNKLIGAKYIQVGGICGEHDLVVDEESLLGEPRHFFRLKEFGFQPMAGNAFICKATSEGAWISHTFNLEQIKNQIEWFDIQDAGDEFRLALAIEDFNEDLDKKIGKFFDLIKYPVD